MGEEKLFLMYLYINVLKEDWNICIYGLVVGRFLVRYEKKLKFIYRIVKLLKWVIFLEIMYIILIVGGGV